MKNVRHLVNKNNFIQRSGEEMTRILTSGDGCISRYHGTMGTPTNMLDSFGNPLFIGDLVITSNQGEFEKANRYLGNEYGVSFVCEEDIEIANWTNKNQTYIQGIADCWNNEKFNEMQLDFEENYWDTLYSNMNGWIVHKIKNWTEVADNETWDTIYPITIQD